VDFAELLINSNGDGSSYYRIRSARRMAARSHFLPRTFAALARPDMAAEVQVGRAKGSEAWTAEFALPFDIFCKNKTLASEIGFNVRRSGGPLADTPGPGVPRWQSTSGWSRRLGCPDGHSARDRLPEPEYAKPKPDPLSSGAQWNVTVYAPPTSARRAFFGGKNESRRSSLALVRLIRARPARCD